MPAVGSFPGHRTPAEGSAAPRKPPKGAARRRRLRRPPDLGIGSRGPLKSGEHTGHRPLAGGRRRRALHRRPAPRVRARAPRQQRNPRPPEVIPATGPTGRGSPSSVSLRRTQGDPDRGRRPAGVTPSPATGGVGRKLARVCRAREKQACFGSFWLGDQSAFNPFAELVHRVNRTSSQRTEGTAATGVTARCFWI